MPNKLYLRPFATLKMRSNKIPQKNTVIRDTINVSDIGIASS